MKAPFINSAVSLLRRGYSEPRQTAVPWVSLILSVFIRLNPRSINIRRGKLESVAHNLDARPGVFRDNDFHDVEPEQDLGIIEHAQQGERAARDAFLFLLVYRCNGPAEIFVRARFHFDKHKRIAVATNNVDLAAAASFEIAIENFIAVPTQEPAGQCLPTRAAPKMFGLR